MSVTTVTEDWGLEEWADTPNNRVTRWLSEVSEHTCPLMGGLTGLVRKFQNSFFETQAVQQVIGSSSPH